MYSIPSTRGAQKFEQQHRYARMRRDVVDTYRNEVNQGGLVFYVLFDVHSQRSSEHGINEELPVDIGIVERLVWRELDFIVCTVTAAREGTSWCHGSCQRHDYLWQGGRSPTSYFFNIIQSELQSQILLYFLFLCCSPTAKKIVMFLTCIALYDFVLRS